MPARSLLRPHVFRLHAGESAEFIAEGQSSERCDWCETLPTSCEGFAAAKSGTLRRIASFFAILRRFDGGESAEFLVEGQSSESCDCCVPLPTSCEGFAAAKSGTLRNIACFFAILKRFDGGESAEQKSWPTLLVQLWHGQHR